MVFERNKSKVTNDEHFNDDNNKTRISDIHSKKEKSIWTHAMNFKD